MRHFTAISHLPQALQRFAGYFEELLDVSPPSTTWIDTSGLKLLIADPPSPHQHSPPTVSEIEKALGSMKSGMAPGVCSIPADLLKAGGETVLQELAAVFKIPGTLTRSLPTGER